MSLRRSYSRDLYEVREPATRRSEEVLHRKKALSQGPARKGVKLYQRRARKWAGEGSEGLVMVALGQEKDLG